MNRIFNFGSVEFKTHESVSQNIKISFMEMVFSEDEMSKLLKYRNNKRKFSAKTYLKHHSCTEYS